MSRLVRLHSGEIAMKWPLVVRVTKQIFVNALSEHFFFRNESFPEKLLKSTAKQILSERLYFHGIEGEIHSELDYEKLEMFQDLLQKAERYVRFKFPELNE